MKNDPLFKFVAIILVAGLLAAYVDSKPAPQNPTIETAARVTDGAQ